MGRRLDYIVLWLLGGSAILAYFLSSVKHLGLAIALTGASVLCLGKIVRSLSRGEYGPTRRQRLAQAARTLDAWRYLPEEESRSLAEQLILRSRKLDGPTWNRLYLLRRHPSGQSFDMNDFLQLWPSLYQEQSVLLAATGPVHGEVSEYVRTLKKPSIELVHEKTLLHMLEREVTEVSPLPRTPRLAKVKRVVQALLCRVQPGRYACMGALLLGMYFLLNVWTYLPAAAFLFLLCAAHLVARYRRAL